jgi:hypothetical protein
MNVEQGMSKGEEKSPPLVKNPNEETPTKFSCTTAGGQKTTCYKEGDPDTACGTLIVEDNKRETGGLFGRFTIIKTAPGNVGMANSTGSTPRPGKYIMQYSAQN